jgi:hypothetical protein
MLAHYPIGPTKLQDLVVEGRIISRKVDDVRIYDQFSADALFSGENPETGPVIEQIAVILAEEDIEPAKALDAIRKVLAKTERLMPVEKLYHSGRQKALRRVARAASGARPPVSS